jgi:tetratricopeptide (TPR) repeat protein
MNAEGRLQNDATLSPDSRQKLMEVIAQLYMEMDLHRQAADLYARRVALLRQEGKASQESLARALADQASALLPAGDIPLALRCLREAESLLARRGELNTWTAAHVFSYMALALNLSDAPAASSYAQKSADIFRRTDPDSEALFGALWMVADTLRTVDPLRAETAASEAMDVARRLHGDRHALYGDSALYLADIQGSILKTADADRNYRIAELVDRHASDARSDLRIQLDLRYGNLQVEKAEFGEAQQRLERALAASLSMRGADDRVYTAWAEQNLALLWLRRGILDKARDHILQASRIYRRFAPDAQLAKVLEYQFDIALESRRLDEASELLPAAAAARAASATDREPGFMAGMLLRQAQLSHARQEYDHAEALYRQATALRVPPVLRFRRYVVDARLGLGNLELARGKPASALSAALGVTAELHGLGDPAPYALQAARAASLSGQAQAALGACARMPAHFDAAERILKADQDPASERLVELAQVRAATEAICRRS